MGSAPEQLQSRGREKGCTGLGDTEAEPRDTGTSAQVWVDTNPEGSDLPHSVELQSPCSSSGSPHLMCGFSLATRSRDSSSLGGVE